MVIKIQNGTTNFLSNVSYHCYPDEKIRVWSLKNDFSPIQKGIHYHYNRSKKKIIFYFEDGILGKNESQSFSKSYVIGYIIHGARNDYMFCLPIIMPVVLYIILVACLLNLSLYPLLFYIIFVVWGIFSDLKKIYSFIFKAREQI